MAVGQNPRRIVIGIPWVGGWPATHAAQLPLYAIASMIANLVPVTGGGGSTSSRSSIPRAAAAILFSTLSRSSTFLSTNVFAKSSAVAGSFAAESAGMSATTTTTTATTTVTQLSASRDDDNNSNNEGNLSSASPDQHADERSSSAAMNGQVETKGNNNSPLKSRRRFFEDLPPRATSVVYMAVAMAFHFGGYEFVRNSALSLFTSSTYGFHSPAAFPLANAFISPFSVLLLYWYNQQLDSTGPRTTLFRSTALSMLVIALTSASLFACANFDFLPPIASRGLVGFIFLFQNTYQYLLYTQQWSFVSSVCTPDEGSRWFSTLAGVSSIFSTLAGSTVHFLLPFTGLLGLMATTCLSLAVTLVCQDKAYALAEQHGFDPAQQQMQTRRKALSTAGEEQQRHNRLTKAVELFQRVPTLAALFCEIVSFQSLNSIVNVAFVRALKTTLPNDLERSSFTGRFFALVSGISALLQFIVLPPVLERVELAVVWRSLPIVPLAVFFLQETVARDSLLLVALAFFIVKVTDYSIRSVTYGMVYQVRRPFPSTLSAGYTPPTRLSSFSKPHFSLQSTQPLDFESRYLGKEIVGVFGSRFGKSGMALLLSGMTHLLGETHFGFRQLLHCSMFAGSAWMSSTWWLSSLLPGKAKAQATVEMRQEEQRQQQQQHLRSSNATSYASPDAGNKKEN